MFGSFLPSLWSSSNQSLLGSREPTLLCNQASQNGGNPPIIWVCDVAASAICKRLLEDRNQDYAEKADKLREIVPSVLDFPDFPSIKGAATRHVATRVT